MKILIVPKFNYKNEFVENVEVKVKNKPDTKDYNKVTALLAGIPQGYCSKFFENFDKIDIKHFYDIRQIGKGDKRLKGHFITLKN